MHQKSSPPDPPGRLRSSLRDTLQTRRRIGAPMLFFRNVGALAIAIVVCFVPEAGPHRFWLAAILVFGCIPSAIWLERRFPVAENGWSEPLFDLTMVVTLVHLVPSLWVPALVIGLMIVQAPSVAESDTSFRIYALFAAMLTLGMTLAAVVHDVPAWELPILCMIVLYPSVIFYSHRQAVRANEIRRRARAVEGLHLVAGGVAHDFNNILAGVMGHADLARAALEPAHPARESIEEVMNGTSRASLLAAQLLSFSGRSTGAAELLDLESELRELVGLMQAVVPKGISLEFQSDTEGAAVLGERAQLQQIVMNLIVNASEATQQLPGTVWISASRESEAPSPGSWVAIRVKDRGVGIPGELHSRIFDPFFSLKERGHGLGLASARNIVHELGGWIEIASAESEGTEVAVWLPARTAPAPVARTPLAVSAADLTGTALIVDDEQPVRKVMGRMLQRIGFEVAEAESGPDALAWLRRHQGEVGLVVLDLRMPGMDGWECLGELRTMLPRVPVVICSGYDPDTRQRGNDPNLVFLPKPFTIAGLNDALRALHEADASSPTRFPAHS